MNLFSTISSNLEFIKLEHSCLQADEMEEIFVKNELKRFTMLSLVSAVLKFLELDYKKANIVKMLLK